VTRFLRLSPLLTTAAVLLSILAVVQGCEGVRSNTLAASGKVTLDGKPLESGQITFISLGDGGSRASAKIENGEFSIPPNFGVKAGEQLVQIEAYRKSNRPIQPSGLLTAEEAAKGAVEQYLPAKYNTQSQLKAQVQSGGDNFFEFQLNMH
jgi:hypothetical protein